MCTTSPMFFNRWVTRWVTFRKRPRAIVRASWLPLGAARPVAAARSRRRDGLRQNHRNHLDGPCTREYYSVVRACCTASAMKSDSEFREIQVVAGIVLEQSRRRLIVVERSEPKKPIGQANPL